jgi:CO/xanthine dehydrogenase Mo-binding subunit
MSEPVTTSYVGRDILRLEGRAKVSGAASYIYNLRLPQMLHAKLHRSSVAHGRIVRIDTSAALALPGEIAVRIVDEDEGRRLNREFRGKDYATNVLTFNYAYEPVVAADLVLCAPEYLVQV